VKKLALPDNGAGLRHEMVCFMVK